MHVFGRWEEAGVPGENPRIHGENMQTPHRNPAVFEKIQMKYLKDFLYMFSLGI